VSANESFGTPNPWTVQLHAPQSKSQLSDARNTIVLLEGVVQNEGDVFAFMARIYKREEFYFQIWRQVINRTEDDFRLIASRQVIPSVAEQQEQHEDVRLSTLSFLLFVIFNFQLYDTAKRSFLSYLSLNVLVMVMFWWHLPVCLSVCLSVCPSLSVCLYVIQ